MQQLFQFLGQGLLAARQFAGDISPGDLPVAWESVWLTRGGERRLISWVIRPIPDESGEVLSAELVEELRGHGDEVRRVMGSRRSKERIITSKMAMKSERDHRRSGRPRSRRTPCSSWQAMRRRRAC